MEFRFRANQQRQPPLLFPFCPLPPPQPLPASYIRVGSLVPQRQSLQELERELHEVRIKEAIIARRIAQKRKLDEEARRDIEVKHGLMMMERYQRRVPLMIMPPQHQLGPRLIGELEFNQQKSFQGSPAVKVSKNLPLIPSTSDDETDRSSWLWGCHGEVMLHEEIYPLHTSFLSILVNLPNRKLVRTKRKADATISRPKDWSCALCQVSMTSEDALNDHLKGKKHRAKSTQLSSSNKSASPSTVKDTSKVDAMAQEKKGLRGGRPVIMQVNGKMHEIVEKDRFVWCLLCKVKCDTQDIMASHLKGKKHLAKEASRNGEKSQVDN